MVTVTDIIAAFEQQERARLAAERTVRQQLKEEAEARTARRKAALDGILHDFAEAIERLKKARHRNAQMERHTSGPDYIQFWSSWDHRMLLVLNVSDAPDGSLRYSAWNGPKETSARWCPTVQHDPALVTTCPTELKVWLAQFLGTRLARI